MQGHYLPADILHRLHWLGNHYPIGSLGTFLLIFGGVYGFLSWRLGRRGLGVFALTFLLSAALVFVSTGVFILLHSSGYRVF